MSYMNDKANLTINGYQVTKTFKLKIKIMKIKHCTFLNTEENAFETNLLILLKNQFIGRKILLNYWVWKLGKERTGVLMLLFYRNLFAYFWMVNWYTGKIPHPPPAVQWRLQYEKKIAKSFVNSGLFYP